MPKRGDLKGDKYERAVCHELSRWAGYTGKTQDELPFRVRSTNVKPIDGLWQGGSDILAKPELGWPFGVEAKKWEDWSLDGLFTNGKMLWGWWRQAKEACEEHSLTPMLIFSRNHFPNYYMLQRKVWSALSQEATRKGHCPGSVTLLTAKDQYGEFVTVGALDDLITTIPYACVKKL